MRLKFATRGLAVLSGAALLAAACGGGAQPTASPGGIRASDYPTKAITIVAPANPGGGFDATARLIQKALTDERIVSVNVSVTNKPGAGGTVGAGELINNSKGDPYQLIVVGRVTLGSQITGKTPAKVSQLTPIARLMAESEVIVTPASSPFKTIKDLMDALKSDAKAVKFAGGSAGGADHELAARLVKEAGGSIRDLAYVSYAGGGEAAAAIIGGQVQVGISGYGEFKGHITSGQMKALAVSAEKDLEGVSIPTLVKSGVNITLENWRLLAAPPDIAQPELQKLKEIAQKVHDGKTWLDFSKANNWTDNFTTENLITFIATETGSLTSTLTELGLVK